MPTIVFRRYFKNDAERDIAQQEAIRLIETASGMSGFTMGPSDTVTMGIRDDHWEIHAQGRGEWIRIFKKMFNDLVGTNADKWVKSQEPLRISNTVSVRPIAVRTEGYLPGFVGTSSSNFTRSHNAIVNRSRKSSTRRTLGTDSDIAARSHTRRAVSVHSPEFALRYAAYEHEMAMDHPPEVAMAIALGPITDTTTGATIPALTASVAYARMRALILNKYNKMKGGKAPKVSRASKAPRASKASRSMKKRIHQ